MLVTNRQVRHKPHLEAETDRKQAVASEGEVLWVACAQGPMRDLGRGEDAALRLWTSGGCLGAGALS